MLRFSDDVRNRRNSKGIKVTFKDRSKKGRAPQQRAKTCGTVTTAIHANKVCDNFVSCASANEFRWYCERSIRLNMAWALQHVIGRCVYYPLIPGEEGHQYRCRGLVPKGAFKRVTGYVCRLGNELNDFYRRWDITANTVHTETRIRSNVDKYIRIFMSERNNGAHELSNIFSGYKRMWVRYFTEYVLPDILSAGVEEYDPCAPPTYSDVCSRVTWIMSDEADSLFDDDGELKV